MKNLRKLFTGALMLGMISVAAPRSEAVPINLTDQNSFVAIDPDSQDGLADWVVDGSGPFPVDHAFQQWFWYRIGTGVGEQSIDTIGPSSVTPLGPASAMVAYQAGGLKVEVTYTLTGSAVGSDTSHLDEVITIRNFTGSVMNISFFQYSDFDLDGNTVLPQTGSMGTNQAYQTDGNYSLVENVDGNPLHEMSSTWPLLRDELTNFTDTTLNGTSAGSGDIAWAFQWNLEIAAQNSTTLTTGQTVGIGIVPEPASLVLFGMSLIAVAGAARRRKALGVPQI